MIPENTIAGFLHAIDLGVDAIEMDVVMNGDGDLLVSHEPYISPRICLGLAGNEIPEEKVEQINIYRMSQDSIEQYDCGLKPHPWFPDQQKLVATKPLLKDVIDTVESYVAENGRNPIIWNIELKSKEKWYDIFQPQPAPYAQALINLIQEKGIAARTVIQCFDPKPLQYIHEKEPELKLAFLVDNEDGVEVNLGHLGFSPDYYSPNFQLVTESLVGQLRERGIGLLVWTVNEPADIKRMLALKPDGIITDYPDLVTNR